MCNKPTNIFFLFLLAFIMSFGISAFSYRGSRNDEAGNYNKLVRESTQWRQDIETTKSNN